MQELGEKWKEEGIKEKSEVEVWEPRSCQGQKEQSMAHGMERSKSGADAKFSTSDEENLAEAS
jgi:hypothetical protein